MKCCAPWEDIRWNDGGIDGGGVEGWGMEGGLVDASATQQVVSKRKNSSEAASVYIYIYLCVCEKSPQLFVCLSVWLAVCADDYSFRTEPSCELKLSQTVKQIPGNTNGSLLITNHHPKSDNSKTHTFKSGPVQLFP